MAVDFDLSDGEVVQAVLAGRTELYRILVRRYQDPLHRHAIRMVRRPDDAADVVQKALVRGYEKLASCRDPEKVGGWLFRICANLCKDFLKSPRRDDRSLDDGSLTLVNRGTPADAFERAELRRRLEGALERLGPEQREAFVMKHLEGWTYEEMADALGASTSALKMRVHRAREALEGLLVTRE